MSCEIIDFFFKLKLQVMQVQEAQLASHEGSMIRQSNLLPEQTFFRRSLMRRLAGS